MDCQHNPNCDQHKWLNHEATTPTLSKPPLQLMYRTPWSTICIPHQFKLKSQTYKPSHSEIHKRATRPHAERLIANDLRESRSRTPQDQLVSWQPPKAHRGRNKIRWKYIYVCLMLLKFMIITFYAFQWVLAGWKLNFEVYGTSTYN